MTVTREMWARSLCRWMGWPEKRRNLIALVAWQAAEGGPGARQARWNPLNTTMPYHGSTLLPGNPAGVREYLNETDGLDATARTFLTQDQGYEKIVNRFERNARPRSTLAAVEASSWGTGGLARSIVGYVKRNYDLYANAPIGQ